MAVLARQIWNKGPWAPLRQTIARGAATLCNAATATASSARAAGPLSDAPVHPPVDPSRCAAFERPVETLRGAVAVACDQAALDAAARGQRAPRLRWSGRRKLQRTDGPPATARSDDPAAVEGLALTANGPGRPEIYLARRRERLLELVRFPR
jgi:hypothetical protein